MGTFLRRAAASRIISGVSRHRLFQSSACARVQVGDELPAIKLVENSPGNTVDVREEIAKTGLGKGLIIGVPAAFSELYCLFVFFQAGYHFWVLRKLQALILEAVPD